MNQLERSYADNLQSSGERLVTKAYSAPKLTCHGDLHALTKSGTGTRETSAGGTGANNGSGFRP